MLTTVKRFLNFFPLHGKTAAGSTQAILDELKQNDLDVMMCRGQGHDNVSAAMSGTHAGVQRRIKDLNLKALFVACGSHSSNLMRSHLPS